MLVRLKRPVVGVWRKGGADGLVEVFAAATVTVSVRPVGCRTTIDHLVGRTPAEVERVTGLKVGTELGLDAGFHSVTPPPGPGE